MLTPSRPNIGDHGVYRAVMNFVSISFWNTSVDTVVIHIKNKHEGENSCPQLSLIDAQDEDS